MAKRTKLKIPKPSNDGPLLLRADFADDAAWTALVAAMQEEVGEFRANVQPHSDPALDRVSLDEIARAATKAGHTFAFVADRIALTDREQPVLVMDLAEDPGRTFRVIPSAAWVVENNLSLANMDFAELAESADESGILRDVPGEHDDDARAFIPVAERSASARAELDRWIYVGNLSFDADEQAIRTAISAVGAIEEVRLARNEHGYVRGFCFARMSSANDATNTIAALNGRTILQRQWLIAPAAQYADIWDQESVPERPRSR